MKIRTGRLILLVLISFSLVCNDLLASSFLARPGYGVTTGHEFDQLNPDGTRKKKKKVTVVAPPPAVKTPGKDASAATRRRVVVVQPPVETPVSASATSKISSPSKSAALPVKAGPKRSAPVPAPIIIEPPPVKTAGTKPTGPAPQIVAAPAIISPPATEKIKTSEPSVPPPRKTGPPGIIQPPEQLTVVARKPEAQSQKATGPVVVSEPLPVKTVEPLSVPASTAGKNHNRQSPATPRTARPAPVSAPAPVSMPDLEPLVQPQKPSRPVPVKGPAVIQAPAEIPASHYPAEDRRVTIHEQRPGQQVRKPEGTVAIAEGNQHLPKPAVASPASSNTVAVVPAAPETAVKKTPARSIAKTIAGPDSRSTAIRPETAISPAQSPAKAITAPERPTAVAVAAETDENKAVSGLPTVATTQLSPASEKTSMESSDQQKPGQISQNDSETVIAEEKTEAGAKPGENSLNMEVTTSSSGTGSAIYGVSSFDSGLHVEATTDLQSIYVEPGRSFTLSFRTTNISGKPGNFIEEFDMPPGFELTFPPAEFSLESMESYNSIVMVTAPAYLPAGEHQFAYRVLDPNNQSVHGSLSFRFNIKEMVDLKFLIEEQPESIIDGENFVIRGKLFNDSNASLSVRLTVSKQYFKTSITPSRASLAPGSFVEVEIKGDTGKAIDQKKLSSLLLTAYNDSVRGEEILLRQNIGIKFYSRARQKIDFKNRLPIIGTMYLNGDETGFSQQFEVRGKGALDSQGRRKIDFLVREKGSETRKFSSFRREESRVHYIGETFGIKLGDHSFGVSPLSKYYVGKGVAVDVATGQKTSAGAVSYKRTWTVTPLDGRGFYVAHVLSENTTLRFNHLSTTSDRFAESPDEKFSTLSFTHRHGSNTMLKGEIARKWGGELTDRRNAAFMIDYTSTIKKRATVNVSHSDTGVIFAGEMVGNENTNSSVNIYLGQNTNLNGYYQVSKQKPLIKTTNTAAVEQSNFQTGLEHRIGKNRALSMSYFKIDTLDWLNKTFESNEYGVMGRISQNWQKSGLNYSIYRKKASDLMLGNNQWNTIHRISSHKQFNRLVLNCYAGLIRQNSNYNITQNENNNYGLGVNWDIRNSLKMRFNYNYVENAGNTADREFWNMNLKYSRNDTLVDVNVKQHKTSGSEDELIYYEIAMSQKFGVPVSRNIRLGALTGHLVEQVGSDSQPLVNATLLLGNFAAVTDKNGRFVFADLKPGTYTLSLISEKDKRFVSSVSLPASLNIRGGNLAVMNIQLEPACSLTGEISVSNSAISDEVSMGSRRIGDQMLAPMPSGFRTVNSDTLYGIVIQFEKDGEQLTTRTGSSGRIIATNFKPGIWRYRVISGSLPDGYKIDKLEGEIEFKPESDASLSFMLTPVIRKIEFVSE